MTARGPDINDRRSNPGSRRQIEVTQSQNNKALKVWWDKKSKSKKSDLTWLI